MEEKWIPQHITTIRIWYRLRVYLYIQWEKVLGKVHFGTLDEAQTLSHFHKDFGVANLYSIEGLKLTVVREPSLLP